MCVQYPSGKIRSVEPTDFCYFITRAETCIVLRCYCIVTGGPIQVAFWLSHLPLLQSLLTVEEARRQIIRVVDFSILLLMNLYAVHNIKSA